MARPSSGHRRIRRRGRRIMLLQSPWDRARYLNFLKERAVGRQRGFTHSGLEPTAIFLRLAFCDTATLFTELRTLAALGDTARFTKSRSKALALAFAIGLVQQFSRAVFLLTQWPR